MKMGLDAFIAFVVYRSDVQIVFKDSENGLDCTDYIIIVPNSFLVFLGDIRTHDVFSMKAVLLLHPFGLAFLGDCRSCVVLVIFKVDIVVENTLNPARPVGPHRHSHNLAH